MEQLAQHPDFTLCFSLSRSRLWTPRHRGGHLPHFDRASAIQVEESYVQVPGNQPK